MNTTLAWTYLILTRRPERPGPRRESERELMLRLAREARREPRRPRRG